MDFVLFFALPMLARARVQGLFANDSSGRDPAGNDTIMGGTGDDLLLAGAGDAVTLGAGADADQVQVLADRAALADWAEVGIADHDPGLDRITLQMTGFADLTRLSFRLDLSLRLDPQGGAVRVMLVDADSASPGETAMLLLEGMSLARLQPGDFRVMAG